MRLHFLGAAETVTGSCYLIEAGGRRVMVDCGMFQGVREIRERNYQKFTFDPSGVDCVLLTHAHIDHSGMIPKLVKHGFKGEVYATEATRDLCSVMLPDSGYIQEMEVERLNRKARRSGRPVLEPVYTALEARECLRRFKVVNYGEIINPFPGFSMRFINAGHILGSAMLEIWVDENNGRAKMVFTGDMGTDNKPFVEDPARVAEADCLVMESTYGDRLHDDREDRLGIFLDAAWETYRKGGNLVIPAFAVERTQDLLYYIYKLVRENRFPPMDVYIDSPMAIAATEVFKKYIDCFDKETREVFFQGTTPFEMPGLKYARSVEESIALNQLKGGAVIISASGMADAGRIKHHLKHNLWRPECTVLFVGYQAEGTKGRKLLDGEKTIRIHGEEIYVRADIRNIQQFSSHADQKELLNWLGGFSSPPGTVFLTHGEPKSISTLAGLVRDVHHLKVVIPKWLESYEIVPGFVYTEEQVRQAHAVVASKLQRLLEEGMEESYYSAIMKQLNGLEKLIEQLQQKKAG